MALVPNLAVAVTCTEYGIWWADYNPTPGYWPVTRGASNYVRNVSAPLGTCSADTPMRWHTSFVSLGGIWGNWVESGWARHIDSNGAYYNKWFAEYGKNFNVLSHPASTSFPCSFTVSNTKYTKWGIARVGSDDDWTARVDCLDGSGNHDLALFNDVGYLTGYAAGEVGRYAQSSSDNATQLTTYQYNLQAKAGDGSWSNWVSARCYKDGTSGWQGRALSANSFDTVTGSGNF